MEFRISTNKRSYEQLRRVIAVWRAVNQIFMPTPRAVWEYLATVEGIAVDIRTVQRDLYMLWNMAIVDRTKDTDAMIGFDELVTPLSKVVDIIDD